MKNKLEVNFVLVVGYFFDVPLRKNSTVSKKIPSCDRSCEPGPAHTALALPSNILRRQRCKMARATYPSSRAGEYSVADEKNPLGGSRRPRKIYFLNLYVLIIDRTNNTNT